MDSTSTYTRADNQELAKLYNDFIKRTTDEDIAWVVAEITTTSRTFGLKNMTYPGRFGFSLGPTLTGFVFRSSSRDKLEAYKLLEKYVYDHLEPKLQKEKEKEKKKREEEEEKNSKLANHISVTDFAEVRAPEEKKKKEEREERERKERKEKEEKERKEEEEKKREEKEEKERKEREKKEKKEASRRSRINSAIKKATRSRT